MMSSGSSSSKSETSYDFIDLTGDSDGELPEEIIPPRNLKRKTQDPAPVATEKSKKRVILETHLGFAEFVRDRAKSKREKCEREFALSRQKLEMSQREEKGAEEDCMNLKRRIVQLDFEENFNAKHNFKSKKAADPEQREKEQEEYEQLMNEIEDRDMDEFMAQLSQGHKKEKGKMDELDFEDDVTAKKEAEAKKKLTVQEEYDQVMNMIMAEKWKEYKKERKGQMNKLDFEENFMVKNNVKAKKEAGAKKREKEQDEYDELLMNEIEDREMDEFMAKQSEEQKKEKKRDSQNHDN